MFMTPLRWDDNPASLTDTGRPGRNMNTNESEYALEPTTLRSMQEAQELASTLEENLHDQVDGKPQHTPRTRGDVLPNWSTTPLSMG